MTNSKLSISKHCEILSIQPESEDGKFRVNAKFANQTNECAACLHIKGSAQSIGQILKCLGEKFASHEVDDDDLDHPLLDRVTFEIKNNKIIAFANENQILEADLTEIDSEKVSEISSRYFSAGKESASTEILDSVPKMKKLWGEINLNRSLTSKMRIENKISHLHDFVRYLGKSKGISEELIEQAIFDLSTSSKNLTEILSSYRLQYFPELDHELKQLQECDEAVKHFNIG